jgi:hypothetical protein
MAWEYLSHPALRVRQLIAAQFLLGCRHILEIGAYKTPITPFLMHPAEEVIVIDPLIEPYECDQLNGHACHVRHIPVDLAHFDIHPWLDRRFGLLFCGMDLGREVQTPLQWVDSVCQFILAVSRSAVAVLEYPVHWQPSVKLFHLLLSQLQPRIAADFSLDLSRYETDPDMTDEIRSRLVRRLVVLKDMDRVECVDAIREEVAKILLGTHAARVVLSQQPLHPVAGSFDLSDFELCNRATVVWQDGLAVTTEPAAWSYAALVPLRPQAIESIRPDTPVPASVAVRVYVEEGEVGLGVVRKDLRQISGERLLRAAPGKLQSVDILVPDIRDHLGLICRNGPLNAISKSRITGVELSL